MAALDNKIAIVTGGGTGIGRAVSRAYAREGATVVIGNRRVENGEAVVAEIEREAGKAEFLTADVADEASIRGLVRHTVDKYGRVDILVNNATPNGSSARLENVQNDSMDTQLDVNVRGVLWAMQEAFPSMKENGAGRIINMASLNGVNAHKYTTAYNTSKEGMRALTRTAAVEWGKYGITSNIICPAAAAEAWEQMLIHAKELTDKLLDSHPMKRMGDADKDVTPIAVFLATDGAGWINGNTIFADGGAHVNGVQWDFDPGE